jgi:cysteinyl-tRNA synthetase
MARRYLGDRFDLHTGASTTSSRTIEDEIAQSAPLVGGPPAGSWVHGEHLLMAGRKMAKSAGNFQRVTDSSMRGSTPSRSATSSLTSRYGHKLNYSGSYRPRQPRRLPPCGLD